MKEIITTPIKQTIRFVVFGNKMTKLEDLPIIKVLNTPNKHLFIEYDENNGNLLKTVLDLDAMGLSHITSVDEFEKILWQLSVVQKR